MRASDNWGELHGLFAFWRDYYVDADTTLCTLCGNSGMVDTRETAISAAGVKAGKIQFCICPNGLAMRKCDNGR